MGLWEIVYYDSNWKCDVRYMGIGFESEKSANDELGRIHRQATKYKKDYNKDRWPERSDYRVKKIKLR